MIFINWNLDNYFVINVYYICNCNNNIIKIVKLIYCFNYKCFFFLIGLKVLCIRVYFVIWFFLCFIIFLYDVGLIFFKNRLIV